MKVNNNLSHCGESLSPPDNKAISKESIEETLIDELYAYQKMLDTCGESVKVLSPDGKIKRINQSGCELLGLDPESAYGMDWLSLLPKAIRRPGKRSLAKARSGINASFTCKVRSQQGCTTYWECAFTPIFDNAGEISVILSVSRNITRQSLAKKKIRYLSEFDKLTNIPNRRHFQSYLKKILNATNKAANPVTLINANLDNFKLLNDIRGYQFGDYVLRVVANRLVKNLYDTGYVARLSSDEFAIIVTGLTSHEEINQLANKLIGVVTQPIVYLGQTINISVSLGIASWPEPVDKSDMLIEAADIALAEVKKSGRGGVYYYNNGMLKDFKRVSSQLELAQFAINTNSITPYYQPKIRLIDGKVVGFEALLRCIDKQGNLAFPVDIWAAFENYSLAEKLGEQIRSRVFNDIQHWSKQGLTLVPISINASPVEFMQDDYAEVLIKQLSDFGIEPTLIEIEITEHMIVGRGAEFVIRAIKALRKVGVRIALDDFGTGYSALSHIKDYSVDVIKVDRSFVNALTEGKKGIAIIKALHLLASCLDIEVIAEGIERQIQCDILIHEGYNIGQGYLFSPAVDATLAEEFLSRGKIIN